MNTKTAPILGEPAEQQRQRWDLVVLGILVNMSLGTVYAWSIFREPLVEALNVTTATTGTPYSVFLAVFAFSMPLGGWLVSRRGPQLTLAFAAILVSVGWNTAGLTTGVVALSLTYGVIGGLGVGLAYGVPLAVVGSHFTRRRGLALGLTLGGFGLSPFVTAPVAELLIETWGVMATFRILGTAFLVLLLAAAPLMRRAPHPPVTAAAGTAGSTNLTPRRMLRTRGFYGLWAGMALGTFAGLTAIGMTAAFAVEVMGLSARAAAISVAAFGILNGVGRPAFGWLTDHIGARRTAVLAFVLIGLAASLVLTVGALGNAAFAVGFGVLWLLLGGWLAIAPTATAAFFGTRHYSANYGIVYTAYGVGALGGGAVSAFLTARTGTLTTTFYAILVVAIIGVVVAVAAIPAKNHQHH